MILFGIKKPYRSFPLAPLSALLLLFLGILPGPPSLAFADDVYTFVIKKQEEKEKYRWNLSDWLTTRDKMRMQDLWLALHSPSSRAARH